MTSRQPRCGWRRSSASFTGGGCSRDSFCGLALLVRPNLLPLALVAGFFVILGSGAIAGSGIPRDRCAACDLSLPRLPFGLLVLWLNNGLYGSPFRTGYGQLGHLFSLSALSVNASRYFSWLVETHTPFPLLAFAAPFVVAREKRGDVALSIGLILVTCAIYFFYTPFDEWSYLRFLLPAIALMLVLASAVTVHVLTPAVVARPRRLCGDRSSLHYRGACHLLRAHGRRSARVQVEISRTAVSQRRPVVRDRLPPNAVVLSVWDSGAVRFHGRKEALSWAGLDPAWLDRSLAWLGEHGRTPYILVESWEEPAFRNRFGNDSDIGKLDWPPKYEIDRVVRIFDPRDRAKYIAARTCRRSIYGRCAHRNRAARARDRRIAVCAHDACRSHRSARFRAGRSHPIAGARAGSHPQASCSRIPRGRSRAALCVAGHRRGLLVRLRISRRSGYGSCCIRESARLFARSRKKCSTR